MDSVRMILSSIFDIPLWVMSLRLSDWLFISSKGANVAEQQLGIQNSIGRLSFRQILLQFTTHGMGRFHTSVWFRKKCHCDLKHEGSRWPLREINLWFPDLYKGYIGNTWAAMLASVLAGRMVLIDVQTMMMEGYLCRFAGPRFQVAASMTMLNFISQIPRPTHNPQDFESWL